MKPTLASRASSKKITAKSNRASQSFVEFKTIQQWFHRRIAFSNEGRNDGIVGGPVAAGLHSLAASSLTEGPAEGDALVCGDDASAKQLALELAGKVVTGRALDAGPLASARALEGMTAVIVNLNRRYKGHAGLAVTGL